MQRNATLDIARLLAALGIVLFHSGAAGRSFGYAALPFFLMLLIVLGLPAAMQRPFGSFMISRAQRLLWPWAIWSAFYGGLKLAEVALTQKTFAQEFSVSMILTGPALHLWFLPFAFVACLMLHPLVRLWPATAIGRGAMLAVLLAASLASLAVQQGQILPVPLAQWAAGLPAIGLGVALGLGRGHPTLTIGTALGILLLGAIAFSSGWTSGLLQLGLASAALLLCLAAQTQGNSPVPAVRANLDGGLSDTSADLVDPEPHNRFGRPQPAFGRSHDGGVIPWRMGTAWQHATLA